MTRRRPQALPPRRSQKQRREDRISKPVVTGLLTFVTRTPVHVGGGEPHGEVDLAIFREHNTGLPAWPATSLKGPLKEQLRPATAASDADEDAKQHAHKAKNAWREMLGSEPGDQPLHEAIFQPEDARLVALPVPSPSASIVWATSPFLLFRLAEACAGAGIPMPENCRLPGAIEPGHCLADRNLPSLNDKVWLADLKHKVLDVEDPDLRTAWAELLAQRWYTLAGRAPGWAGMLKKQLVIVSDAAMQHLSWMLEVRGRNTQPAADLGSQVEADRSGNLWFEENLPDETLMFAPWSLQPLLVAKQFGPDLNEASRWVLSSEADANSTPIEGLRPIPTRLRIGGKGSVGRGRINIGRWVREPEQP